jgi:hypothetical protein
MSRACVVRELARCYTASNKAALKADNEHILCSFERRGRAERDSSDRAHVPEGQRKPQFAVETLIKKNRQFLAKPTGVWYCFSEWSINRARASRGRRETGTSALREGNDSEMAPQAIGIAQNGLGDPAAVGKENRSGAFRIRRAGFRLQGAIRDALSRTSAIS